MDEKINIFKTKCFKNFLAENIIIMEIFVFMLKI